jgi:hypothetical protein
VQGQIDFTPFLDSGANSATGVGFAGDFSYLHVTALGDQTAGGRIQEGVDAVTAGGIVNVLQGTFIDNVEVDKSVEIMGAGQGLTTVLPSFVGANTGGGSIAPGSSNVFLVQADNVTIHDLTIDGNNSDLTSGVLSNGVDVDARNGIITDHTLGVFNALDVHDVTVKNIYLRGIYASSGGTFSFVGNTVDNVAGEAASIAIFNFGGSGLIQGNIVSNANDAIAANHSKGTQFLNNIVTNSGSGIHTDNNGSSGGVADVIQGNQVSNGSIPGGSYGIFVFVPYLDVTVVGNTVSNVDVGLGLFGGQGGSATFTGNSVDTANRSGSVGAWVTTDTFGFGQMNASATFDGNNDISNADTGILIEQGLGAVTEVEITGNAASIHGNAIGIDVAGGSADISGNHIYDNTTGIRFTNGGSGSVDGNNFEGGAGDNVTDLRLDADAGAIVGGALTGNTFAGSTYFIDNRSAQDLTALRSPHGDNFYNIGGAPTSDDFAIEGRIFHEVDNAASGLVTWVPNTIFVTPTSTPTASDNDYTRIANALGAASAGDTILLGPNGGDATFNWDENFALASWELGNDGLAGTDDDWGANLPVGLSNVTITADIADGVTIHGPGDLASTSLETGFLAYNTGAHQNVTISNFTIEGIANAIGIYYTGGADFSGLTIENMHISVPVDDPSDGFHNIGIHYAFGQDIKIQNNTIDLVDGGADSFSVGVQSNTHTTSDYDDLEITGNVITVTGDGDGGIIGIWENGHAHASDMMIAGNTFQGAGNPTTNDQTAFVITSHSGATTAVKYFGNIIDNAQVGFEWLDEYDGDPINYTGTQAVQLTNNALTDVNTGVMVGGINGSALLSNNSLINSGAMLHVGIGVDVAAGASATIDGSPNENSIVGFNVGISSAGTLFVMDNDASIHGNVTGIAVTGGAATITNNHIYDNTTGIDVTGGSAAISGNSIHLNTTGIRFATTGAGSVAGNTFDNASDDNLTDLLIESSAGTVTIGAGNFFAGNDYFIDNRSTQSFDLFGANAQGYQGSLGVLNAGTLADDFRIEDHMFHGPDNGTSGVIYWVENTMFVTTPGTGDNDETIQQAIDTATAGDTINVEAGEYDEQVVINKSLTLQGAGNSTVIKPSSAATLTSIYNTGTQVGANFNNRNLGGVVQVSGVGTAGVTLRNLKIDAENVTAVPAGATEGVGLIFGETAGLIQNVTVEDIDSIPLSVRSHGMWINAVGGAAVNVEVDNATVNGYSRTGILSRGNELTVDIHDSDVTGPGTVGPAAVPNGITLIDTAHGSVTNNVISAGHHVGTSALTAGILLFDAADGVMIQGNEVFDYDDGIIINDSDLAVVQGNNFHDNLKGIRIEAGANNNNITGNTITNSSQFGIELGTTAGTGNTLTSNIISATSGVGINLLGGSVSFGAGNTVTGGATGLAVNGATTAIVGNTLNDIAFTGQSDFYVSVTGGALDNVEIDGTAASFGGVVGGGTLAQSFAIEDKLRHALDDSAVGHLRFKANEVFVTTPGTGLSDETVANAVAAAVSGDTIYVQSGTYTDTAQIVIDKNLNIIGEGKTSTIFTKNFDTGASGDPRGWWLVNPGVALNLSHVGFDGTGQLTWQAIRHKGSGTIDNVGFTEIKFNPSGPDYAGTAIVPLAGSSVTVSNSMFSQIGRVGVLFFGAGATGTFQGNTYTGKGVGDWLDYGVEVGAGAVVNIIGNSISGNLGVASVDGSTSAGVLVTTFFGPGSEAHFSGANVISGNTTGVHVGFGNTDTSDVTINGGQFIDNTSNGIHIRGASGASLVVDGATVTGNDGAGISAIGVMTAGPEVLIQNTNLTNNGVGIYVDNGAIVDAGLGGNTSLVGTGPAGASAGFNTLTGYTGVSGNYAIEDQNLDTENGDQDVYARNNAFGTTIPAAIEQVVFHTVDDPAVTEVIFTSPIAPPNTPFPPLMVFVDDSWAGTATGADADTPAGGTMGNGQAFGYDQFATIQDGIDAVAAVGGTVYVYAGTYIEAINVHKSLDLISEDAFFSTAAGDGTDDSVINPSGVNSVVVTISAGDVEMAGFTIDGDSVDSYGILATTPFPYPTLTGLEIRHNAVRDLLRRGIQSDTYLAEFDIHHNQVSNITGDAAAIAIFNYGGGGLPGTATIHHNTITGSTVGIGGQQSAGMQVHDNNITMIAGGIGIQDSNPGTGSPPPVGATETFENNIISGGDSTSAGLIVINSAMDVLIKGNTVTTPGLGLGAFGSYSPSTITFDDNTVLADDIGIQISTDTLGLNGFQDVTAIIQNDNDISGAATGILVEELGGAVADVTITGNDDSIHGNAVGIDVVGGTVTISNNDIYDNGIGVRLSNATGDLTDNNIDSNYVGISVLGASTLTLTGGTIDDNESNGLIVVGDGVVKQTIVVSGTSFSSNSTGKPVSAGHGDITLFDFAAAVADPSTASFTDVTITSDMPDYAIQVRGVAGTLPFLNGSTTAEVTFNNVDILGTQQRFAMLVQQYADLSDFSFTDVTFNSIALGGLVMFDTGGTLDLGDSTFHDTYIAGDGPGNGTGIDIATSLTDVDASGVTFVGADKTTLAGNFAIEDRVGHYIDADASPLTAGFVDWIDDSGAPPFAEAVFVTQESYAPAAGTTTPKIQRGINASIAGYNVYVQGGAFTYAENLTIGKDLNLIGETGNTPNLQSAAGGGNVITIDGSGFGDDETVTVDNFNFNGVSGVGDYGIRVNSTAVFDRLAVSNSSFTGFDFNAIAVFGDLADGISVADVDLTNLTFSNNGLNGGNGTGDVQFFDYNGDATLTNLDMVGSATASTGARGGIQFRGASASGAPGAAGVGVLPMGTIVLNDIDVSGDYRTQMIGFQRYTNSNITFTDVKLGGVGSEITGTFGASLRFDAVGFGSLSSPIFVDLGNTHFRGLDPLSAQRHEIEFAPDNGHTFLRADGDATQWDIGGMTFVAAALTLPQAFNVEDRILHYVDKLNPTHGGTHGPYKGFVDIKPGEAFIGDDINSGLLGDGSIQRGVNIVAAGGTVHVEGGSFTEAVNVNKHVKIIGAGSTGLGATVLTQPVSSDIITITASGASNVDRLLLEGMQLMPVGAGTHGIIITGAVALEHIMLDDVKVTGSSPAGPAITEIGFRIMDFASVNDLVIVDSLFENLNHGMLIEKHLDITGASNVTNLSITNTGFEDNQSKGFYAEKLSDATFTDVWATGNGNLPFFVSGAGIEINLKGSLPTYENLVFNNLTVTNNGLGTPSMGVPLGAGLQIKARGTGGDTGGGGAYAANPALLDDVEINGGTFTGNRTGIRIGEPGQLNTSPTNVVIDGVTVTGSTETGINVVGGVATIQDSTLTNNPTGILVNGAGRAIIINNLASITGGNIGIDVNGANARALVENTYFDTNQIGVRIQNGGLADLGQLAGAEVDYTGLGESAGLNDFTSYTTAASATNGAIVNLNTGGAYSNAGQQGHSGPEHDVEAFNNLFDNSNPIDTYIWHDADSTALGFVDYGTLADLTVSFQPLPAIDDAESIDEGSSITVYGSFTNDAQAHTVTISWGDGSPDTVLNLDPGEFTFSATTLSGTYDDDPDGAVQSILHNITVTVVETATPANQAVDNSLDVTVNNFVPTIPLADQQGDNTINEGQTFNLVVGPRNDPGVDTISAYTIFWGDGDSTFVSGDPLTSSVVHSHLYADGLIPPTRTITIDVLDDDGTWMNAGSLVIDVNNVNPTAANFQAFNPTVNEGGTTNVFFSGPFVDPGSPDTPFHFAYDFDNDGTFDLGNGTYAGSGTASSAAVPSSFLADDDDSPRTVRGRIIDNDGGFTDYTVNIGINNVAPVVNAGPDTTVVANSVLSHTVTFTDPGADSPWTVSIDWDEDAIFDETFMVPGHSFDIADYSTWTYGPGDVGSTFTVVVQVDDNDGGVDTDTFDVLVVEDTLRVIDFEFNASGFDVTFNRAPNLGDLNLYDSLLDGSSMVLEAPDLTLVRNGSEQILGSIVWAADTNTLSFVKTGGVLADGNYDVTLVSSAIGFHDGLDLLDGDGDFDDSEVGDDYERSFTIDPPPVDNRVVSIGDFSRGTGQDVNVPTVEMGGAHLPVNISDANGVESVDVDILYNHTLLNISDAYLGAGPLAAGGWSITTNFINVDASHTLLKITISGVNAMSGSNVELIKLDADVPSNAPYGASQVVQLLGLRVNEDLIPSLADNAIHKVTYVGDADGSGLYGGGDSTLISRVVVFTDSGFDAHDWTDPQIVGDASGDGTLSGLDASYVAQEAVDIDRPEVPPIPGVMLMMVGGGIDPEYSIDENIPAQLGQSVIVPVKLEVMPGETNMVGGTFVLNYDEDLLTYQSPVAGAGWNILFVNSTQPGVLRVSYQTSDLDPAAVGESVIADLNFEVGLSGTVGEISPIDIAARDPNELGLTWTNDNGSAVITGLPGDYNRNGVVDTADWVVWMKLRNTAVPIYTLADGNGDGFVDDDDYDIYVENFGETFPGAGGGAEALQASADEPLSSEVSSTTKVVFAPASAVFETSEPTADSTVSFVAVASPEAPAVTNEGNASSSRSARDSVLADFAGSQSSGRTAHARPTLRSQHIAAGHRGNDDLLLDLAIAARQERAANCDTAIDDDEAGDNFEALDELFSALDEEKVLLAL